MRLEVTTPPASEPVSLTAAKLHCGVLISDWDTYFAGDGVDPGIISAARDYCERKSSVKVLTQTIDLFFDTWDLRAFNAWGWFASVFPAPMVMPPWTGNMGFYCERGRNVLIFPYSPCQSVTQVQFYDTSNTLQTWDSSNYIVSPGKPGRLSPIYGASIPSLMCDRPDVLDITYVAGYGDDATSVPPAMIHAIKLVIQELFRTRSAASEIPLSRSFIGVDELLNTVTSGQAYFG